MSLLLKQTDKRKKAYCFFEIIFFLSKNFLTFKDYIFKFGKNKYLIIWICDIHDRRDKVYWEVSHLYKSNIFSDLRTLILLSTCLKEWNIFKGIYDSGNQYLKVNHITLQSVLIAKILANPHSNLEFLTRCFEETF